MAVVWAVAVVLAITEVGAVGAGRFVIVKAWLNFELAIVVATVVSMPPGNKQTLWLHVSV